MKGIGDDEGSKCTYFKTQEAVITMQIHSKRDDGIGGIRDHRLIVMFLSLFNIPQFMLHHLISLKSGEDILLALTRVKFKTN